MMHGQAQSDNEIYLLIKYIKSLLWRVAKRLSYTEDSWCLKVKNDLVLLFILPVISSRISRTKPPRVSTVKSGIADWNAQCNISYNEKP